MQTTLNVVGSDNNTVARRTLYNSRQPHRHPHHLLYLLYHLQVLRCHGPMLYWMTAHL